MNDIWNAAFWKAAGERAIRTFCQMMVTMVTVGQALTDVQWIDALSISAVAALISVLTSIVAGIPEVKQIKEQEEKKEE